MIGLIAATAAGRRAAIDLAESLGGCVLYEEGSVAASIDRAWEECGQLVCFLATGATVRLVAPLLAAGFTAEGVQLQASRLAPLPGEVTRLAAVNPVFVLRGTRIAADSVPISAVDTISGALT